jgi:hypothetical protein
MQILLDNIVLILFIPFFAYVFYSIFSKKGKGRMLGGSIVDTSSDEITQKSGMLTTTIRAHVVESKSGDKHVGIEISENAKLGASFKPIKLSKSEADTLVRMINEASAKT